MVYSTKGRPSCLLARGVQGLGPAPALALAEQ